MGMVSQIALGLATALPNCRIFALDTDGSMLLAPSILPVIGTRQPKNLYIFVFDNEQLFGSRGGPASQTATGTDIAGIAKASGLENVRTLRDKKFPSLLSCAFLSGEEPSMPSPDLSHWQRRRTKNGWTREQIQIRPAC